MSRQSPKARPKPKCLEIICLLHLFGSRHLVNQSERIVFDNNSTIVRLLIDLVIFVSRGNIHYWIKKTKRLLSHGSCFHVNGGKYHDKRDR